MTATDPTIDRMVPRAFTLWNVVPHLAEARALAEAHGEPIAIYRYCDEYGDDVFFLPVATLAELRAWRRPLAEGGDLVVIEAVVAPPR